jgi:peroxiredoxin
LEAKYAGREKIDGVECDRVNMKQEGLDWRLFTTTGEKPLARRIEVTIPQQLDMSMDFTEWKLSAAIPNERFKFVPPPGAKKVDKLLDEEEKEGEDSDLVDEPMPKLKLKTLEGDVFDSAALKGHPTILVVWSGEAEHCLNAIKAAMDLAAAKKIAIYSINIDEKPDKLRIKNFLKTNKLNVKTAIDENREAVEKLEMEGVPTTFLIDKAGVIRKAYLGFHKDFKGLLEKEIEALQAEKK